jgi:(1->4)-alpha-D-glucan 1-alpha-D-glucosylmutase
MRKALQEAKVHTSWINPNSAYDEAIDRFVSAILDQHQSRDFLSDLRGLQSRLSHLGIFNSLSETVIKLTAPGVADFYQGTELWDFSLVDPDNRRPVDYERRRTILTELQRRTGEPGVDLAAFGRELVDAKNDGRIKLFTIWRGLHHRRNNPGLFTSGDYEAIDVVGDRSTHIFSFLRRSTSAVALTVVPRLLAKLIDERPPLGPEVWGDSTLRLPTGRASWRNVFTNEVSIGHDIDGRQSLRVADVLRNFPVAILLSDSPPAESG